LRRDPPGDLLHAQPSFSTAGRSDGRCSPKGRPSTLAAAGAPLQRYQWIVVSRIHHRRCPAAGDVHDHASGVPGTCLGQVHSERRTGLSEPLLADPNTCDAGQPRLHQREVGKGYGDDGFANRHDLDQLACPQAGGCGTAVGSDETTAAEENPSKTSGSQQQPHCRGSADQSPAGSAYRRCRRAHRHR